MRLSAIGSAAVLLVPLVGGCAAPAVLPASADNPAPGLEVLVAAARADAARRFGLAPAAFALVSARAVTWRDGSLGCPQPGMAYSQALVPGARILLRGPSGDLDYHAALRGGVRLCPPGQAVDPLPDNGRT